MTGPDRPPGPGAAVVVGGASGLGEATARRLRDRGTPVTIVDRDGERGAAVAETLGASFCAADVADETAVDAAFAAAAEAASGGGGVRAVVNCAGIGWADRLLRPDGSRHPLAGFEKVMRVNLVGTFTVLRAAAQAMAGNEPDHDGGRGVIVNTASVAAYDGQTGQVAYAASKGGVVAMTLPAARDLAVLGIRVCTIVPGLMDTPLAGTMPPRNRERLEANALYPKRFGRPEEFAALALHVIDNRYLNAACLRLDAGMRMPVK